MWRSLWQTPAALTLINTCVPDGCGVASSNSFSGALKSATLKLFIGVLPAYFLLSHHHATSGEARQTCLVDGGGRWQANLVAQRIGVLAEHGHRPGRRGVGAGHPERQIEHLERAASVLHR